MPQLSGYRILSSLRRPSIGLAKKRRKCRRYSREDKGSCSGYQRECICESDANVTRWHRRLANAQCEYHFNTRYSSISHHFTIYIYFFLFTFYVYMQPFGLWQTLGVFKYTDSLAWLSPLTYPCQLKHNYKCGLQSEIGYATMVIYLWRPTNITTEKRGKLFFHLKREFNSLQVVSYRKPPMNCTSSPRHTKITSSSSLSGPPTALLKFRETKTGGFPGTPYAAPADMVDSSTRNSSTRSLLQYTRLCQGALQDLVPNLRNLELWFRLGFLHDLPSLQVSEFY